MGATSAKPVKAQANQRELDNDIRPVFSPAFSQVRAMWVCHKTGDGRTFYRRAGDDSSITREAPAEGVRETKDAWPGDKEWNEEKWQLLLQTEALD